MLWRVVNVLWVYHFFSKKLLIPPITVFCWKLYFMVSVIKHLIAFPVIWRTLQWRHNECGGVSNHQPHDCLLSRLFRRGSEKTSKLHVTGLCEVNSPVTGEFTAQRASNAKNASIWWRHHNRQWLVDHCGWESDLKIITCGVPLESILEPSFFLLYMNDLSQASEYFMLNLFTDDTDLFATRYILNYTMCQINKHRFIYAWLKPIWFSLIVKKTNKFHPFQATMCTLDHKMVYIYCLKSNHGNESLKMSWRHHW